MIWISPRTHIDAAVSLAVRRRRRARGLHRCFFVVVIAVGAVFFGATGVSCTAPLTSQRHADTARAKAPRAPSVAVLVPLSGRVGFEIGEVPLRRALDEAIGLAEHPIVVLHWIAAGEGDPWDAVRIAELFQEYADQCRIVSWVRHTYGAGGMAALACDDVLFEPDGRFGMIVSIWAVGCSPNDARVRANIEAVCRFAALTNRPQESLLRFAGIEIGPSATPADMGFVWRDEMFGEGVAARFSSDLVLPVITPATLLEHGLDVGTAATFTELERALGLDACLWSFEIGERIMTEWADTVTRTEREVVCLLGDFYLLLVQYEEATTTLERARLRDELGEYLAEAEAWITTAPDLAARHGLRHDVLEMMRRVCSEDK